MIQPGNRLRDAHQARHFCLLTMITMAFEFVVLSLRVSNVRQCLKLAVCRQRYSFRALRQGACSVAYANA